MDLALSPEQQAVREAFAAVFAKESPPARVREMEADGIATRRDFQEIPPRVEYALTEFGVSLLEALRPLCDWGREHMERIERAKQEWVDQMFGKIPGETEFIPLPE